MPSQLSPKVQELIAKARIVSFEGWQTQYSADLIERWQAADDAGRYLTDEDLQGLPTSESQLAVELTQTLRDRATEIVDEARAQVLDQFPGITEPGGGLYPEIRAKACWRDFWHFLRCITYGIAARRIDYTSATGLGYMEQLYQELRVPLDAMVAGLEGLKMASLKRVTAADAELAPYFDHLIQLMASFQTQAKPAQAKPAQAKPAQAKPES
ncbi:MAG: phycobilisome protein [Cyanobacteria bacterium P01_A01_bin.114]